MKKLHFTETSSFSLHLLAMIVNLRDLFPG